MSDGDPKVAIACQGGGSHTAFTAGVLRRLFAEPDLNGDIVGISGTSGGAVCALLSWYGRVHPDRDSGELLRDFWAELAARRPAHQWANAAVQWGIHLGRMGVPLPEQSPYYSPGSHWGEGEFRRLLGRYVDFDAIPELLDGTEPALLLSAINVLSGEFRIFREDEVSPDALLASAAEPHLFEAAEHRGNYYWDGLFSKNPPLKDFMTAEDCPDPDEIWLVKINPQERARVPKTSAEIADRRNELSGNLSLNAELRFLQQVNEWIEEGYLPDQYTHTEIERIHFARPDLHWRTKLDRSPEFIERLIADGEAAAESFLEERAVA
ncbi:patatin-like phospholipase family protein [Haloarcula nitratireducens]|uniref:Patatin-like phospholipase family protein n=1 Tax=Haloarcula nitratireducens TaxID=2487749 RepID=A0AAW4P8W8_9EURY|nr:patatin-like phospholipase family protein [Halomicroarcula nitratireducens]MBX0294377.1 patatin-like phospholipase family protein [Halomicroarcula nitratireducens]